MELEAALLHAKGMYDRNGNRTELPYHGLIDRFIKGYKDYLAKRGITNTRIYKRKHSVTILYKWDSIPLEVSIGEGMVHDKKPYIMFVCKDAKVSVMIPVTDEKTFVVDMRAIMKKVISYVKEHGIETESDEKQAELF